MSIITEGQTIRFVFFKIYSLVRASTIGRTCDFKGKCASKQCPCKKNGVFCSTKCHSKRGCCENMGE